MAMNGCFTFPRFPELKFYHQMQFSDIARMSCGVKAKVLDCSIEVSKFDPKSRYYVHFQTKILGKGVNPHLSSVIRYINHYRSLTRMILALDNPGRLIYH